MADSPHFKPDSCALVLIDHQIGTMQLIRNITSDQSVRNAVVLGKAALELARKKLDFLRSDFDAWEATTVGADFPEGTK